MKIIGNRLLVSKVEDVQTSDFKTVEVQDSFLYKGKVEQLGDEAAKNSALIVGQVVLFARNSPDTQDVEEDGKKLKVVAYPDIIAIL